MDNTKARRAITWLVAPFAAIAAIIAIAAILIAIFGWNWAKGPIQRIVYERTGRALVIGGDLTVKLGWPIAQVRANNVTFANPTWASQPQMLLLAAGTADVSLSELLHAKLVVPVVDLTEPIVNLEISPTRQKNWLLDKNQSNEEAHAFIGKITLKQGQLNFLEPSIKTKVQLDLSTPDASTGNLAFKAGGLYKGLRLIANGKGGPAIAIRDETNPYPLAVRGSVDQTSFEIKGQITSLVKFSAVDLQLQLRGDSLGQLYPLIGVRFPATRPYTTAGQLVRDGTTWRYNKFDGKVGRSDIAGDLQVDVVGNRPTLKGNVTSQQLAFEDLGPPIGAGPSKPQATSGTQRRVLPDIPFNPESWNTFDADVTFKAVRIIRDEALPLDQLTTKMQMRNAVLTLSPLDFSAAGGQIKSVVTLDGSDGNIKANATIKVQNLSIAKLFPTVPLAQSSIGQLNGQVQFTGNGNSVAKMLATADGNARMVVGKGEISNLLMEKVGLHLIEILQLTLAGDKTVALNCVVADFGVKQGVMTSRKLVLDTAVTTVVGDGQIDLGRETLDLRFVPKTRRTSLISLRSPISITGPLNAPTASLNAGRIIARGTGAILLGLINPLLALVPLIDPGPGVASECTSK